MKLGMWGVVGALALMLGVPAAHAQGTDDKPKQDAKKTDAKTDATAIAGKWNMTIESPQGTYPSTLEVKANGKKLTGTLNGQMGEQEIEGSFSNGKLSFSMSVGGQLDIFFEGKLKDDGTLAGTMSMGPMGDMKWSAEHVKDKH